MDFVKELDKLKKHKNDLEERINDLENKYKNNAEFTIEFLKCCEENGIKKVGIQKGANDLKGSIDFPFGNEYSVYADERLDGWPAVWKVCDDMKISGGCGNSGQHQISSQAAAKFINGVYELKDGVWHRRDD